MRRIIYLGALASGGHLSPHMRSRLETGNILRSGAIPVLEFQASVIIGSGSASFELIRALVERLPVMITPRWVNTASQPIGIEDVIEYLVAAISVPLPESVTVQIGGSDVTSYVGLMREFARQRKLRRWFIRVPFLSLSLSSRWLTLITPVYASIGRCLIESVRNPSVVQSPTAAQLFAVQPMGIARAIERALANEDRPTAESRWCDARANSAGGCATLDAGRDVLTNEKTVRVPLPPDQAFAPICRIGGKQAGTTATCCGGFAGSSICLWAASVCGEAGPIRTLRTREVLWISGVSSFMSPAGACDFSQRCASPGRAWLEFRAEPDGRSTVLRQTAQFEPSGLAGLLYWYFLWPIHELMFRGMLRRLAAAAIHSNRE